MMYHSSIDLHLVSRVFISGTALLSPSPLSRPRRLVLAA